MRDYKLWSEEDTKYLLVNYQKIGLEKAAKKLKRTIPATKHKVIELGILEKKSRGPKFSLPVEKLVKLLHLTNDEICEITGLELRQVQNFRTRNKQKKAKVPQPKAPKKRLSKL